MASCLPRAPTAPVGGGRVWKACRSSAVPAAAAASADCVGTGTDAARCLRGSVSSPHSRHLSPPPLRAEPRSGPLALPTRMLRPVDSADSESERYFAAQRRRRASAAARVREARAKGEAALLRFAGQLERYGRELGRAAEEAEPAVQRSPIACVRDVADLICSFSPPSFAGVCRLWHDLHSAHPPDNRVGRTAPAPGRVQAAASGPRAGVVWVEMCSGPLSDTLQLATCAEAVKVLPDGPTSARLACGPYAAGGRRLDVPRLCPNDCGCDAADRPAAMYRAEDGWVVETVSHADGCTAATYAAFEGVSAPLWPGPLFRLVRRRAGGRERLAERAERAERRDLTRAETAGRAQLCSSVAFVASQAYVAWSSGAVSRAASLPASAALGPLVSQFAKLQQAADSAAKAADAVLRESLSSVPAVCQLPSTVIGEAERVLLQAVTLLVNADDSSFDRMPLGALRVLAAQADFARQLRAVHPTRIPSAVVTMVEGLVQMTPAIVDQDVLCRLGAHTACLGAWLAAQLRWYRMHHLICP